MFVYVMADAAGHSKIGISKAPKRRLINVRNGNPRDTTLFYCKRVPDGMAAGTESRAHALLKSVRTRGEWFAVSPVIARQAIIAALKGAEDEAVLSDLLAFEEVAGPPTPESAAIKARLEQARPGLLQEVNPWH